MLRLLLILIFTISFLYAQKTEAIKTRTLKDGSMIVKIAFNYEDITQLSKRVRGVDGYFSLSLPIPGNWKVLSAKGYLSYAPSLLLQKEHSSGVISLNQVTIKQYKLFENLTTGVKFSINPKYIKEYNKLDIEMIQHYTDNCENSSNSQLWTDINLVNSYIEFHIEKTAIPEEIHSLTTHMMDEKQYSLEPINYVISPQTTDNELRQYALLTGAAANSIKYRKAPISVSHHINLKKHNILVTTRAKAKKRLKALKFHYLFQNDPLYSMHFNTINSLLPKNSDISVQTTASGVSISSKKAFYDKSLTLKGGKITLNKLALKNKKDITVAFWFRPDSIKQTAVLFGFESYRLVLSKSTIGFTTTGKDLYGGRASLHKKRWHHIVAHFSTTNIHKNYIYVDGHKIRLSQIGRANKREQTFNSQAALGGNIYDNKRNFRGAIDQFYIFDKKLNRAFISKMYQYAKRYKHKNYSDALFISEMLRHDINVLRNPGSPDKAILVIAPKDKKKINEVLYGFFKKDLTLYFEQGLNIHSVKIPQKAPAYSAPDYIPVEEEVTFKELGYQTQVLRGWYPPNITINFKVYPDHHFNEKDRIKANLNYVFPTTVNSDSVANIFLNNKFAKQIDIMKAAHSRELSLKTGGLLDFGETQELPVYLLNKGNNKFKFEFSLVPEIKGGCSAFNTQNLLIMLMDNSYFTLPKSSRWIEMPYMDYVNTSAYPYSKYPDLQDTQVVLTNTRVDTIAAAMNFIFFITQEIKSYPYYLNITKEFAKADKERELVLFGSIHDKKMQKLSQDASISFSDIEMNRPYPFVKNFTQRKELADSDKLKKYKFIAQMKEDNQLDTNLLVQMYRSPFNDEKTVLMFAAEDSYTLNKSLKSLLSFENRHLIKGDAMIYNAKEEMAVSFNIADKYILTWMNIFDKIALEVSMNPIFYLFFLIITVLLLTWFLRRLLKDYKSRIHKDVD